MVLIGPSGAGKSTLLRVINHLEPADAGAIFIDERPVYRYERDGRLVHDSELRIREIRAQVGMVFQHFNLFPHLTVLQNIVEAPIHVRGLASAEAIRRARVLLKKVALAEKEDVYPVSCREANSSVSRLPARWLWNQRLCSSMR